ncbi:MAG: CehA/McbA family metallohydrolase [Thermoproteota archaeon]|nr:CehA/McbA family metallohydrolase [Candidatus Brockarchaeota archaeon]
MKKDLFSSSGIWVKGNLHTHTKNSDGLLSPEEVISYYSSHGYDFLAITDHEKVTAIKSEKIVLLPGSEISVGKGLLGDSYHILAINVEDNELLQKYKNESVQTLLNFVNKEKSFAIVAHPYWSKLTHSDLLNIEGYIGVEVYNGGCDVEVAKGFSTVHWDNLLSQRINVYGFATDDAHHYSDLDSARGWINVKVKEKSIEEILSSIKKGNFYSSSGPVIEYLSYDVNKIEVRSSPVERVDFISEGGSGLSVSLEIYNKIKRTKGKILALDKVEINHENGNETAYVELGNSKITIRTERGDITSVNLEGVNFKNYFRVEVTDHSNKKAWSNPIFL